MSAHPQREAFLANQRWFAGKGRDFEITEVTVLARLSEQVRLELVEVRYAEGSPATETYQMPVVAYAEAQDRLGHALVREGPGERGPEWTYDAVHDRDAMAVFLEAFHHGRDVDAVEVHRLAGHDLDTTTHSTVFGGEQSNSSVAFGDDSLLKVFRKVTPGTNPDVEIHEALTLAGNTHVAALYGYLTAHDGELHLGMLQQFLRTASDGWGLALSSARNLFAEGDLHADEVGGDFAAEAHRLGATVAEIHGVLAEAFGTSTVDGGFVADQMSARLDAAAVVVPALADHVPALRRRFELLRAQGVIGAQRVHGDLHLGQTLRTSLGWKLVDFEGEPAKPLSERRLPDSAWRDVAGMVRSFDYAAASMARDLEAGEYDAAQIDYRAHEWVEHNVRAFLDGYAEQRGTPITPDERALLDAYVLDKAVYEAAYEARNRPDWLTIPLAALADLVKQED
ncbi:maltokinase N-terminal cap-like domain-containing protein [Marmoricola sp. RAF53]|uniref:maltokinase N-terminal cap-like domain-containing protein n=1 Tax=Marmoricola sp. RAF53 TaxID=3233059 RepID=UPI003F9C0E1E